MNVMLLYRSLAHVLAFTLFLLAGPVLELPGQSSSKKVIGHEEFDSWKSIDGQQLSADGRWVAYELKPGQGDPVMHLYDGNSGQERTFDRGQDARFSADSRYLVFRIKPPMDSLQAMRRRKVDKNDLPGDTLAIFDLSRGTLEKTGGLKSFKLPGKWPGWLAYQLEVLPAGEATTNSKKKKKDNQLVIRNLANGEEIVRKGISSYTLAEEGPSILFALEGKDSTIMPGVFLFSGATGTLLPVFRGKGDFQQLTLDRAGRQAAFLADLDTTKARLRPFDLYHWTVGADTVRALPDANDSWLPDGWRISENGKLQFAKDGSKLFFGIAPSPVLADTTLLEEEIVNVEVWNYRDPRLYTQEEVLLDREKKRTYQCVWHLGTGRVVQLAGPQMAEVSLGDEGNAGYVLGFDESSYLMQTSWEGFPVCKDVYLVDIESGSRKQIATGVCGSPELSPEAKFVYWYSNPDSAWYAYWIEKEELHRITNNDPVPFYNELNDLPDHPGPYGIAGWTTQDDFIMIYDRYDIWLIDPKGMMPPNNLTRGREAQRQYRYIKLDPEERAIEEVGDILLHFQDEKDMQEGYVWYNVHTGFNPPLQQGPFSYSRRVQKARDAQQYVFTRENFQTFPDLLYSKDLKSFKQISKANPQQADYRWGSIELYEWTSLDGQPLRGLLVKPEGFDPAKKYPMIVNFYERNSQRLHDHRPPVPNRSQITYAFYASRGYVIFNPDIPYRVGYPGESAFNAVISGVSALIDEGFVDRERIGVQGHSWGGYQIAYLLTKTDIFRCAESGAPVVNMVSAYGGIRWGSGLSRMFQYEHTQSRIGGALWEYPLRYLENSPVFSLDKITTPVLILHNDEDGAVPWYQGIEFFVGLRRLGKPAWLLNYNGEPHWPVKYQNRKDFQRRMQQFFDYYLQDAPKPRWMEEGVPPIVKGIDQGFDPVKEE